MASPAIILNINHAKSKVYCWSHNHSAQLYIYIYHDLETWPTLTWSFHTPMAFQWYYEKRWIIFSCKKYNLNPIITSPAMIMVIVMVAVAVTMVMNSVARITRAGSKTKYDLAEDSRKMEFEQVLWYQVQAFFSFTSHFANFPLNPMYTCLHWLTVIFRPTDHKHQWSSNRPCELRALVRTLEPNSPHLTTYVSSLLSSNTTGLTY